MNSKILTVLLIVVSIFLLSFIIGDFPKKEEVEKQAEGIRAKIESLEKEEERLKGLADYYRSESYLEKQARLRLNLKKEGENVVFVYRKSEEENQETKLQSEKSILLKIREWFRFLME